MGGKGSPPGPSQPVTSGLQSNETELVGIADQQLRNAQSLFSLTEPGLVQSENYFQTLASGDPGAVMRATAPTAQAANAAATGAKSNIMANAPAGGEKNLALEQADLGRAAQIASTASGASQAANTSLASLEGQGVGQSISEAGTATGALSAGTSALTGLGGLQLQGQQLQMEQKGQELGAFGGLAGDATQLGSAQIGAKGASGGKGSDAALTDAVKGAMLA